MYEKALKDDSYQAKELIDEAQQSKDEARFPFKYETVDSATKAKEAIERIKQSSEVLWNNGSDLNDDKDSPRPQPVLRTTPQF
jgi:hypothetical protein